MSDAVINVQMRIAAIQRQLNYQAAPPAAAKIPDGGPAPLDFATALQKATAAGSAQTYDNGKWPDSALVSIGDGERLAPPAASGFMALKTAASAAGVTFDVNDSYRSYDQQVQVAQTKGLYGQGGLAAVPGTSTHGKGLSVDLELDAKAQSWMKANAGRYGFVNDVRGEPWHWTYKA